MVVGKKMALAFARKLVIIIGLQIGYQAAILRPDAACAPFDPHECYNEATIGSHCSGLRNRL